MASQDIIMYFHDWYTTTLEGKKISPQNLE
jgi:hypothetical protein